VRQRVNRIAVGDCDACDGLDTTHATSAATTSNAWWNIPDAEADRNADRKTGRYGRPVQWIRLDNVKTRWVGFNRFLATDLRFGLICPNGTSGSLRRERCIAKLPKLGILDSTVKVFRADERDECGYRPAWSRRGPYPGDVSSMRWLVAGCCLLAVGCASFRDAYNQDLLYLKMASEARKVWKQHRDYYVSQQQYPRDFELGFQDGYIAVALGASGCPPTLPRKEYWHPDFRNDEGKARVATWYNGYAGLSSGVQDRNRLPTASEFYGRHYSTSGPAHESALAPAPAVEELPPEPETPALPAAPPAELSSSSGWRSIPLEPVNDIDGGISTAGTATVSAGPDEVDEASIHEVPGEFGLSRPD